MLCAGRLLLDNGREDAQKLVRAIDAMTIFASVDPHVIQSTIRMTAAASLVEWPYIVGLCQLGR